MKIDSLINKLKDKIRNEHLLRSNSIFEGINEGINEFISDTKISPLERAFYLILNQFPTDEKHYIVYAQEKVLIPNIYDNSFPAIEYEIDFALYGGSIESPVKVAIECDGLRSHGNKNTKRDRRKDVNLQASGWIIMRFTSKEIHEELEKFDKNNDYVCGFLFSVEKIIQERTRLISYDTYTNHEFRSKLTGYKWGLVTCSKCGFEQHDTLNHKKITCRKCKEKYFRVIDKNEKILEEMNGLLFFE
jgi:very-short-patch-repair endonuclease